MVRTRSGIEVRLTEKHVDEDEIIIEDDNIAEEEEMETVVEGEDDHVAEEEEIGTTGEGTRNGLYNVILYYGGHFVHVPFQSYTSNVKKVYKGIDFENLSINELKLSFGVALGEFDSLYFKSPELKIYLLNDESKPALLELAKECGYNVVLYVYHVTPAYDSDIEREGYCCTCQLDRNQPCHQADSSFRPFLNVR